MNNALRIISILVASGLWSQCVAEVGLDWFTVAGGGGMSSDGRYSLGSTIGQPEAGTLGGTSYTLASGFWGVGLLPTPSVPLLGAERTGGDLRISWPRSSASWVLEENTALTGPTDGSWVPANLPIQSNATHIFAIVPAPSGTKFYRLRQQP